MATTLPPQYRAAKLRCVLPYHADIDRMGVGIDLEDGTTLRLALDGESARVLAKEILDYLGSGYQSPRSSEVPSVDGSVMPGQSQPMKAVVVDARGADPDIASMLARAGRCAAPLQPAIHPESPDAK